MKRPFVWMAVALVLGEWMAQYGLKNSVESGLLTAGFTGLFYMVQLYRAEKHEKPVWLPGGVFLLLPVCCMAGAWLWTEANEPVPFAVYMDSRAEKGSSGMEGILRGTVEKVEPDGDSVRLWVRDCTEETLELETGRVVITADGMRYIPVGSQIRAEGWIYLFPRALNPGQFDTRTYYASRNVQAGMKAAAVTVEREGTCFFADLLQQAKLYFARVLEQICEPEKAGIFQAVLLGMSRQVDAEQKSLFQGAGIAHLLSISGLHISCLAMAVYQFVRRGSGSFVTGLLGGGAFLLCYGYMVGGSASAFRAMAMFCLQMTAACFGRRYDMLSAAGAATIGILIQYPLQVTQSGFWLTFLAVAGIGAVYPAASAFVGSRRKWVKGLLFSLSVQMTIVPVILYSSYVYPVYGILLNVIVVPLAAYLLFSAVTGALFGGICLAAGIFFIGTGHYILELYERLCRLTLSLPGAQNVAGQPSLLQCFVYYGLLCLGVCFMKHFGRQEEEAFLLPEERRKQRRQRYLRAAGMAAVCMGLYLFPGSHPDGALHVTMLDVGQGECIHLQLPEGSNVVIDGGSTDVQEVGTYRIVPYLLSQGVSRIDLLVLTHPDADHVNGIMELLEDGRIETAEIYLAPVAEEDDWKEIYGLAEAEKIPIRFAAAGSCGVIEEVTFTCLHPYEGKRAADVNDNSVVLMMKYRGIRALFTGDLSAEAEDFLGELEPVSLLKAAHHGSKYSTSEELLHRCQPEISVISCGAGNRYGHPHEELLERLAAAGCNCYITAGKGALLLQTWGEDWEIRQYQSDHYDN